MSVNIDCYAEVFQDGRWSFAGEIVPNPEHQYTPEAPLLAPAPLYDSMSKELAAILVDTGRPVRSTMAYTPIVKRRGIPIDVSQTLAEHFAFYSYDDAILYSWFTTQELLDFDLASHEMVRQSYVDKNCAAIFAGCPKGFPYASWPADTPIRIAEWSRDGVEVAWRESYAEIIQDFADFVPPAMLKLGTPQQTRLVVSAGW